MRLLFTFLLLYGMACAAFAQTQFAPDRIPEAFRISEKRSFDAESTEPARQPAFAAADFLLLWPPSCKSVGEKKAVAFCSTGTTHSAGTPCIDANPDSTMQSVTPE